MSWTIFQHRQTWLLLQWQEARKKNQVEPELARGIKMETTKRKHRKVETFQCITSENNAFVFSLLFTSRGQAFIPHCSSLTIYSTLFSAPNPTRVKPSHSNKKLSEELRVGQKSQPCV